MVFIHLCACLVVPCNKVSFMLYFGVNFIFFSLCLSFHFLILFPPSFPSPPFPLSLSFSLPCPQATAVVCQSLLLGLLSQYFTLEEISTTDTINAYLYALGLTLISICLTFINGIVGFYGYKLSMLVRIVTCSAIYQKVSWHDYLMQACTLKPIKQLLFCLSITSLILILLYSVAI